VLSATTGLVQRRSNQSVEFLIVEMLDRAGKVSRQNMSRLFSHAV
jgi:predicted transcriptional regulator